MKDRAETLALIMQQLKVSKTHILKSIERVDQIQAKIDEIDDLIQKTVISYDLDRIQTIEKTVLRLSVFDLIHENTLPPAVIIAEALRLTKKFGTPAATSFVHAVLDAIYKLSQGAEPNSSLLKQSLAELQQSEQLAHEASLLPPAENQEE